MRFLRALPYMIGLYLLVYFFANYSNEVDVYGDITPMDSTATIYPEPEKPKYHLHPKDTTPYKGTYINVER